MLRSLSLSFPPSAKKDKCTQPKCAQRIHFRFSFAFIMVFFVNSFGNCCYVVFPFASVKLIRIFLHSMYAILFRNNEKKIGAKISMNENSFTYTGFYNFFFFWQIQSNRKTQTGLELNQNMCVCVLREKLYINFLHSMV